MRVFPPARTWARIPSWAWHRAGVEGVRARTIIGAAHVAERLEEIAGMTPPEADLRLRSLPGIGPWTSAETRQRACGDADAVSVGDVHLPGGGRLGPGRAAGDRRRRACWNCSPRTPGTGTAPPGWWCSAAAGRRAGAPGWHPATTGRSELTCRAAGQAVQGKGVRSGSTQLVLAAGEARTRAE